MTGEEKEDTRPALEAVFREEAGRVLAALIARLGDFDLAEDAFQEAVSVALERWPRDGVPDNPAAWLTTTARRRVIDRLRHRRMQSEKAQDLRHDEALRREEVDLEAAMDEAAIPDERLRLIFTCCHPALSRDAQVALTLRTLGGLSTGEVARAFLVGEDTMTRRLTRAKTKIRGARIPYEVPGPEALPERIGAVLGAVYLIFNQGYSAAAAQGDKERRGLCGDAIRLVRVLSGLLPDEPEILGLEALLLLHDARRDARVGPDGEMIALEDQTPGRWHWDEIREGRAALERAARYDRPGPYQLQAAISAVHVEAAEKGRDGGWRWPRVARLYEMLEALHPTPVVTLNRAVAVGRAEGAAAGLALLDALAGDPRTAQKLADYQPYYAARADLLRAAGRGDEAAAAYRRAIELAAGPAERRFLEARLAELAEA